MLQSPELRNYIEKYKDLAKNNGEMLNFVIKCDILKLPKW